MDGLAAGSHGSQELHLQRLHMRHLTHDIAEAKLRQESQTDRSQEDLGEERFLLRLFA